LIILGPRRCQWNVAIRGRQMQTVTVRNQFAIHPDELWHEIQKTRLLLHVARPILKIRPLDPSKLPEFWEEKDYEVSLCLGGVFPIGRQTLSITWPKTEVTKRSVRDNGHGRFVRRSEEDIGRFSGAGIDLE